MRRTRRNYLIPIGAKISLAKQLPILGVNLSEITRSLERVPAKASFVVAATSRSRKGSKEVAKGLVPERKLDGMIVAFATRPGETAEDNLASGFARSMITYHFINGTEWVP